MLQPDNDWSQLKDPFPKKWADLHCEAWRHRLEVHLLDRTEHCNFPPFIYLTHGFDLQIGRHKGKKRRSISSALSFQMAQAHSTATGCRRGAIQDVLTAYISGSSGRRKKKKLPLFDWALKMNLEKHFCHWFWFSRGEGTGFSHQT